MLSPTEDTNGSLYQAIHRLHFHVQNRFALLPCNHNLQKLVLDTNCSSLQIPVDDDVGIVKTLEETEDETLREMVMTTIYMHHFRVFFSFSLLFLTFSDTAHRALGIHNSVVFLAKILDHSSLGFGNGVVRAAVLIWCVVQRATRHEQPPNAPEATDVLEELEIQNNQEEVREVTWELQLDVGWSLVSVCLVLFLVEYTCGAYWSRSSSPEPARAVRRTIQ